VEKGGWIPFSTSSKAAATAFRKSDPHAEILDLEIVLDAVLRPFAPEAGAVTATFDKGVLHVGLPKPPQQAEQNRRIPIRGATPA